MSAHSQGSGPRSNAYSESKFTNWAVYDPFWMEAKAALKRFDGRMAKAPEFPAVIELKTLEGFVRPCSSEEVQWKLRKMRPELLVGLRAVFLLSGTRKQERIWKTGKGVYGQYARCCVFLFPQVAGGGHHYLQYLEDLRDYYLGNVLPHEVAHHHDRFHRQATQSDRETFANGFVERGDAWVRKV